MLGFVQASAHAEAIRRVGEFCAPGSCYVEVRQRRPARLGHGKGAPLIPYPILLVPGSG